MKIRNILELSIKDLKSLLDHISGYILITVFLSVLYFFFLRAFFVVGIASLRQMFTLIPWIMIVFVPAITMGAFAQEKDKQTIEYLITKPISTFELIFGKMLSGIIFLMVSVLLTLPLAFFVNNLGKLDWGEVFAGYLAILLLITALVSIGVMISSFFKNQITAFLVSAVVILILMLANSQFISINLPVNIANLIAQFSLIDHFNSIARGVLQIQDIVYFTIILVISTAITYINIAKIQLSNTKSIVRVALLSIGIALILGSIILYSTSFATARIDLTTSNKYTLTDVTKEVLNKNGKIKIEVYASENMPQQFQVVYDELKNTLSDYDKLGGGNLTVEYKTPDDEQKLKDLGIQPVQFNVIGNDEYQVKQGYLGLVVRNEDNDKQEVIPFVQDVNTIEYDLTSLINKVKTDEKPVIGIAQGNGEHSIYSDYTGFKQMLETTYTVESVALGTKPNEADDQENSNKKDKNEEEKEPDYDLSKYSVLIITAPKGQYSDKAKENIKNYIDQGGSVVYLPETTEINQQLLTATSDEEKGKLLESYGIKVNPDMVYDLDSHENVTVRQGLFVVQQPYPLWIHAMKSKSAPIPTLPDGVAVPWTSSLEINDDVKDKWNVLYETSDAGGKTTDLSIDLKRSYENKDLGVLPLMVMEKTDQGGYLVVAGTGRIFTDEVLQGSPTNAVLGMALMEHISQSINLSQIQAKSVIDNTFYNVSPKDKGMVKFMAPVMSILLLGLIGVQRIVRKKRLVKRLSVK